MRKLLTMLALAGALASSVAAKADTVSLAFTSDDGFAGGTGSLSLSGGSPANGTYNILAVPPLQKILTSSFSIDGYSFGPSFYESATFTNGVLTSLDYIGGSIVPLKFLITLGTDYSLTVGSGSGLFTDDGTITAVPEPSTLALFGTGLLGLAGMVRRRMTV